MYQMDQNVGAAERCCNEALRIDPECDAAVATLAQLNLQQGRIEKAIEYFERQASLARTETELVNALSYQFVSKMFYTKFFMDGIIAELTCVLISGINRANRICKKLPGDECSDDRYGEGILEFFSY